MVNKQTAILNQINTYLETIEDINFVGFTPDFHKIGNNLPATLIKGGNEELLEDMQQNGIVWRVMQVSVFLFTNKYVSRIQNAYDLQASIEDVILDDVSLNGTAECVKLLNVMVGDDDNFLNNQVAGTADNLSLRIINFEVQFKSAR